MKINCGVCNKPVARLYLSGKVLMGFSDKWKCKECADKQDNKEKTTTTESPVDYIKAKPVIDNHQFGVNISGKGYVVMLGSEYEGKPTFLGRESETLLYARVESWFQTLLKAENLYPQEFEKQVFLM